MNRLFLKNAMLIALLSAASAVPAWATPREDCQRAIDEVSNMGHANYDSATEAKMTKYLDAANTFLMQSENKKALGELRSYQRNLSQAVKAKKVSAKDKTALSGNLSKAMKCVEGLK